MATARLVASHPMARRLDHRGRPHAGRRPPRLAHVVLHRCVRRLLRNTTGVSGRVETGHVVAQVVAAMASSVMMVLTAADPPAFTWHGVPVLVAAVIALAALVGLPGFRRAPLPVVLLFVGGVAGSLVTRGWAYEGRFSIHLFGAASVLCTWGMAAAVMRARDRFWTCKPAPDGRDGRLTV